PWTHSWSRQKTVLLAAAKASTAPATSGPRDAWLAVQRQARAKDAARAATAALSAAGVERAPARASHPPSHVLEDLPLGGTVPAHEGRDQPARGQHLVRRQLRARAQPRPRAHDRPASDPGRSDVHDVAPVLGQGGDVAGEAGARSDHGTR